ncbi:MAG TPA: FAD-dependent oxidoreductase [Candidatus Rifleibacterium sp.]|nr:FAD-dependent oxidoreductase [Candidatus Rifleibacterium sp.]
MQTAIYKFLVMLISLIVSTAPVGYHSQSSPVVRGTEQFDVIVVGGDPEGIAAAIAAAREGCKTLLVDTRPVPGGLFTRGWLNTIDMNMGIDGRPLNGGIFAEIYQKLDDQSFDVAGMIRILEELISREKRLTYIRNARTVFPMTGSRILPLFRPGQTLHPDTITMPEGCLATISPALASSNLPGTIEGIEIHTDRGLKLHVSGKMLIDATQDADLAAAAGAGSIEYGVDTWGKPRNMAATLVFRIKGISDIDWRNMCAGLSSKASGDLLGGKKRSIWGYGDIMRRYAPTTARIRVRGLNLGRQNDGSVLVNALLVFATDGTDQKSRKEARQLALKELPELERFLRAHTPGMQSISISETAPEMYIRTSRQIKTLYTVTVDDILENRDFHDRIGFGSYPLDIQAQSHDHHGDVVGRPEQYALPLRCLVPEGFTNLLVVGRSAGFDSQAQSSARTVPVGIAAGQAAGVTAAQCIESGLTVERAATDKNVISQIQQRLIQQGVLIGPNPAKRPEITKHPAYEGLCFMRRRGLASGGYRNNYELDEKISSKAFANRLVAILPDLKNDERARIYKLFDNAETISSARADEILAIVEKEFMQSTNAADQVAHAKVGTEGKTGESAIITSRANTIAAKDRYLTRGEAYMLLMRWFGQTRH